MNFSPKINRKNTALFLTALFMISATVVLIAASEDTNADDVEYDIGPWKYIVNSDGNAVISEWNWEIIPNGVDVNGVLSIPGKLKAENDNIERTVISIRGAAGNGTLYPQEAGVKEIELPESLKTLSDRAFQGCTTLETIDLTNVTKFEAYTFRNCTSLKNLTMPNSTFAFNRSMSSAAYYSNTFDGCTALKSIDLGNLEEGSYINEFQGCTSLEDIKFPERDYWISSLAGCTSLEHLDLTYAVGFGGRAFENCTSLKDVIMPKKVGYELHLTAFLGCTSLEKLDLRDVGFAENTAQMSGIKEYVVGSGSAYDTINGVLVNKERDTIISFPPAHPDAKEYTVPAVITKIGSAAFHLLSLDSIDLNNVTVVDEYAFFRSSIKSIDMNNVKIIGVEAFYQCADLISVNIPNVETIGKNAFYECISLTSIDAPKLKTIEESAFGGRNYPPYTACNSLSEVNIPSVEYMGTGAFQGCAFLVSIDISSLKNAESEVFRRCPALESVIVPDHIDIADMFMMCENIKEYLVSETSDYASEDGVLYSKDMKTLVRVPPAWGVVNFIVPEGVETLNDRVFKGYAKLVTVDISNVTEMRDETFYGCTSLVTVDISQFVTVGDRTFYGCTSLEYIDLSMITYVGDQAFYNCERLESVDMVVVEYIGYEAFYGCHNFTMAIAPKVKQVGDYAFFRCDSLLVADFPEAEYVGQLRSCKSLRSLDVSSATFVGGAMGCMALDDVKLPETPYVLGGFESCGFKILDLKGATKVIGRASASVSFSGCRDLVYFSAPNLISMIGGFNGCARLAYVYMPMLQKNDSDYQMFKDCTLLELLYMPKLNIIAGGSTNMFEGASVNRLVVNGINSTALSDNGFILSNLFFTSDYKSSLIPSNISPNTKVYRSPDATGWNESYEIFHTIGFYVGEHKVLDDVVADNGRIREPLILKDDRIWTLEGEAFDFNQRITSDLVLRDGAAPVHIVDGDNGDSGSNTGTILATIGSVIAIVVVAVIFLLRRPA